MKNINFDLYLTVYIKINLRYIWDLNERVKFMKFLENKIEGYIHDLEACHY